MLVVPCLPVERQNGLSNAAIVTNDAEELANFRRDSFRHDLELIYRDARIRINIGMSKNEKRQGKKCRDELIRNRRLLKVLSQLMNWIVV